MEGKKLFFIGLTAAAIAGGGFAAYKHFSTTSNDDSDDTDLESSKEDPGAVYKRTDSFPLKKGSQGNRVSQLQQALTTLIGVDNIAKYTTKGQSFTDGKFGTATAKALTDSGYPATLDEKTFTTIIQKASTTLRVVFNPTDLANKIYDSTRNADINAVISSLSQIKNTSDYWLVENVYKTKGIPGFRKTLVTDLLDTFADDSNATSQLTAQFTRMGLKENPDTHKWSLSGFKPYRDIITLKDTYVVDQNSYRIPVKKNTILGEETGNSNGITSFKALDNTIHLVPTSDIKHV